MRFATAPNLRSATPRTDHDRCAPDRESSRSGHAIAPPCVPARRLADSPRIAEPDLDGFRALGAAVGEVVIVEDEYSLYRGELEADASGVRVRTCAPIVGEVVRVRRRQPERL